MSNKEIYFTEQKVLSMAACQGMFVIDQSKSQAEEKQDSATKLANQNYLEFININKGVITYKITDDGRDYLKVLNGHTPKHRPSVTVLNPNDVSLEHILAKRIQVLRSANKRGLDFNLTDANVRSLLKKKTCYYTGVEFDTEEGSVNNRTFERIDDTKGYLHGNVVAVTLKANRIKNMLLEQNGELSLTIEQFIKMAEQLKKHIN